MLLVSVGTLVRWNTLDSDLATSLQAHLSNTLFVAAAYIPLESLAYSDRIGRYRELMDRYVLPTLAVVLSIYGVWHSTTLILQTYQTESLTQTEKKYAAMLFISTLIVSIFVLNFLYDEY